MILRSFRHALAAVILGGATLQAQADTTTTCPTGPGAFFGITGYQCANCSFARDLNGAARYTFNAEPTVLATTDETMVQAGDVIVAVNSQPIVSRQGSDQFTYPSSGPATLTVRRGERRVDLLFNVSASCRGPTLAGRRGEGYTYVRGNAVGADTVRAARGGRMSSGGGGGVGVAAGAIARTGGGSGGAGGRAVASGGGGSFGRVSGGDTVRMRGMLDSAAARLRQARRDTTDTIAQSVMRARPTQQAATPADFERQVAALRAMIEQLERQVESSKVAATSGSETDMGRFGLALGCTPSCTRVRAPDGSIYWKYDDYPPIVALRTNGPGAVAGLAVGDVVTAVDGISILTAEGAQRFFRASSGDRLSLTIRRGSDERRVIMSIGRPQ